MCAFLATTSKKKVLFLQRKEEMVFGKMWWGARHACGSSMPSQNLCRCLWPTASTKDAEQHINISCMLKKLQDNTVAGSCCLLSVELMLWLVSVLDLQQARHGCMLLECLTPAEPAGIAAREEQQQSQCLNIWAK